MLFGCWVTYYLGPRIVNIFTELTSKYSIKKVFDGDICIVKQSKVNKISQT